MSSDLTIAISGDTWENHLPGDASHVINANGCKDGGWKIAYYPLFGIYNGDTAQKNRIPFAEPIALIEKPLKSGIDFRESH